MTLESRPNQPQKPEGISAQQQERFNQLQTEIMGRLKPNSATIVVTSDENDPPGGYHLSVNDNGHWSIGFGREGIKFLNGPNKPPDKPLELFRSTLPNESEESVELLDILKAYALIQNSSSLDQISEQILSHQIDVREYLNKSRELRRGREQSVSENPGPFAESFLRNMQNTLEQLSRE